MPPIRRRVAGEAEAVAFQPQSRLGSQPGRPDDLVRPPQCGGGDVGLVLPIDLDEGARLGVIQLQIDEVMADLRPETVEGADACVI